MSIANLKDSGNQGNNMPWQWKVLKGLQGIYDEVKKPLTCAEDSITICPPPGGLPVVIDCDDRISLCVDGDIVNAANALPVTLIDPIPLEVDINQADDSILIYGFDGVANQPIAVNPSGVLAIQDNGGSITVDATNLDIRDLVFATDKVDVSNSTVALDATTLTALENITVQNGAGASAVNIQDGGNSITIDATALPLPTGAATETTLLDVKTSVQLIDNCVGTDNTIAPANSFVVAGVTAGGVQQTIEVNTSGHVHIADGGGSITVDSNAAVRTPTVLRVSANSSVAIGAYSVSFASVGTVDATVGGQTLKPGETINFDAGGINNTLASIAYDSSVAGAELLIITLT